MNCLSVDAPFYVFEKFGYSYSISQDKLYIFKKYDFKFLENMKYFELFLQIYCNFVEFLLQY